ncbi:MAG: hypothetical protein ABH824_01340 [Nanoarchaeota archaeon]|nr:hypothetical protein [Nanoarchaeota archaeon]MBU1631933.1 hypothetical protein [Nanoarchaeota archaeon]MBU1876406.1 hypothetical protein [Nanoarchaeota archaeon]
MNKKIALTTIVIILSILLINLVSANLNVESGDLTFKIDYEDLQDNDDELDISQAITVSNNGNTTENISFSLEGLSSQYSLSVSPTSLPLNTGESSEITVSGKIPVNVDQGIKDIGNLKITGAIEGDLTYTIKTDVQSMLEIKDIYVYVNDNKVKTANEDDEEVKNLEPGDEIELRFQLDNLFDEDYDDGDIEGSVNIILDNSNFGEDVDEEESFDINAGENEEVILKFTIPNNVEEDNYNLEIAVEGKDGNKAKYETNWNLNLNVERRKDDVRIEKISLSTEEVSCFRRSQLTVEVTNFGSNKQKHAALSIDSTDLNINMDYMLDLADGSSDDNSITKQLSIDLDNNLAPGIYPIIATAYYDYDILVDKDNVNLIVKECPTATKTATKTEEDKTKTDTSSNADTKTTQDDSSTTTDNTSKQLSSSNIVKTVESNFSNGDYIVALIIVAIIVVFIMIILLLIALLK